MTRTDEPVGGSGSCARISSAVARLPSVKRAFMISRSRRGSASRVALAIRGAPVRQLSHGSATDVTCQPQGGSGRDGAQFVRFDDSVPISTRPILLTPLLAVTMLP